MWPVALYGSESRILEASLIDKLNLKASEMICYRRVLRISWRDLRTNKPVLNEIGADRELVATVIVSGNCSTSATWSEQKNTHLWRSTEWHKKQMRARRRWGDDITDWTGKTSAECTTVARDKKNWRELRELVCRSVVSDLQQWRTSDDDDDNYEAYLICVC